MERNYYRKQIRLPDYDYSTPGCYFITACTKNHEQLLGQIISVREEMTAQMMLNRMGEVVREAIEEIPFHYTGVEVVKYIVMPNHFHLVLSLSGEGENRPSLSTIIQQLKRAVSLKAGRSIWQSRYYDHVIRNAKEFQKIWDYIDTNPKKWELDKYYQE